MQFEWKWWWWFGTIFFFLWINRNSLKHASMPFNRVIFRSLSRLYFGFWKLKIKNFLNHFKSSNRSHPGFYFIFFHFEIKQSIGHPLDPRKKRRLYRSIDRLVNKYHMSTISWLQTFDKTTRKFLNLIIIIFSGKKKNQTKVKWATITTTTIENLKMSNFKRKKNVKYRYNRYLN